MFTQKVKDKIIKTLNEIEPGDSEVAHLEAEFTMCEFVKALGHEDVAAAYEDCKKRVNFQYA